LIWALSFASLFTLSACDYGRMWETPAVRPHEEPILEMPADIVPFDGGEAVYRATSVYVLRSPIEKNSPVDISRGRALYLTYCAQCHGNDHDGNGTVGQSFHPLPRDLQHPRIQALTEGRLFKEISYGIPEGRQPPLATTIDAPDRWKIIAYIKSLDTRN
jgi:mono/diheme cytochrome c family protein